jgi:diacylglycerol kinase (ATP)
MVEYMAERGFDGPARRRLLVIHNPIAGRRRRRQLDRVLGLLAQQGIAVTFQETAGRGHAETLARDVREDAYDAVVAAGGDGTINEIVNGLSGRDVTLGIVPVGTGNVLAAELELPVDAERLAAMLASGPVRRIHLGEVDGRLFTMMAGLGFDAHVIDRVDLAVKRRFGKLAYVLATLRQLKLWDRPSYRIAIDGVVHECASVIAANGHYYGGRFVAAPQARLDAPNLEFVLFGKSSRGAALRYAAALACGLLGHMSDVRVVRGREIVVAGEPHEPVQADGDIVARLPATIRVAAADQRIIVP